MGYGDPVHEFVSSQPPSNAFEVAIVCRKNQQPQVASAKCWV